MLDSPNQIQTDGGDEFCDNSDWDSTDSDLTPEEEEEGPPICLDEDGFSLLQSNDEEEQSLMEENPSGPLIETGFAADFYRSGSDWSCLKVNSPSSSDSKKLKQPDLFQMWGLKRYKAVDDEEKNEKVKKLKKNETQKNGTKFFALPSAKSNSNGRSCPSPSDPCGALALSSESMVFKKSKMFTPRARACPFCKKIPGTTFTVDAFRYGAVKGCTSYFLSHFHADHYGGLTKAWSHGPIYCTPITARLVRMCLSVNPSLICPLELDVEHVIDGIRITLLDANHCPGAAMIHFYLPDGRCYLHTGDFRACKLMQTYSLLTNKHVDVLYLDTTYCNPKYRFPSKEEVLDFVVRTTKACLKRQPRTLIIVGAYSIGKECVYIAVSEALRVKIYANVSRRRILQSFEYPQLSESLCSNGKDTPLHIMPISSIRHETLQTYLKTYSNQFTAILAFRPTGWTFSETIGNQLDLIKPNSKGNIQIYGVPYSEHSSFTEMQEFVQFLKPDKIIPTVNISNAANREKLQSHFRQWLK